ncbi:MAG: type II toxin-antitoxin system RelE/ParE family toxin [Flavobacteriaceae bacterium]|jgi:mRNA-degrading endonuclease RelE of RelBE toxin-antitoxin system|nr:type II toxin-antitoxin system RelE/ParE family toxin [Flavobacteriaceae bacterium]
MNYNIELSDHFKKEAKRLIKKYRSLKSDLAGLFDELEQNPTLGTPLGSDVFKIRLAIESKGKGKRGSARVITYVKIDETIVLLLSIYNKGEKDNISDKEILELLEKYAK